MNLGRLEINRFMAAKYPEHTFESIAHPSVFFKPKEERIRLLNQSIAQDGCNVIVASSSGLFDDIAYAREFPNITFIAGAGQTPVTGEEPSNHVYFGIDWGSAAFVLGAVAASASETCGAFVNAFETSRGTWNHAMGFVLGYRWVKPHQPVHLVTMNSYYNPEAEVLAAKQLVERLGCDVVARHTDPNDVDKYINQLNNEQEGTKNKVLSMARYVDMSTFVGDSAFTSQVWDPFEVFLPIVEESFLQTKETAKPLNSSIDGTTKMAPMMLSPITSAVNQTAAALIQDLAWEYLDRGYNPTCGSQWRHNATTTNSANTNSNECYPFPSQHPVESYLLLPNVTYYDAFQDGASVCGTPGGQYYTYEQDLSVLCHACPINTYQPNNTRALEGQCLPCPIGTTAPMLGSMQCTTTVTTTNDTAVIAISITAALVLFLTLAASYCLLKKRHNRDNTHAPKHPHKHPGIAILFTDIQASTTLWANAPNEMASAVNDHHLLVRQIIKAHKGYEVKTIGDAFMIAHNNIQQAVQIALEIQQVLYQHDWKTTKLDEIYNKISEEHDGSSAGNDVVAWNGLRIRIGIAYGTCDGSKDPVTGGWDYYGTLVNTAARTEAAAHGGQVLITGSAYKALLMDQNVGKDQTMMMTEATSEMMMESSMLTAETSYPLTKEMQQKLGIDSVKSHGLVPLRGLTERVELLEIVPSAAAFSQRQFPSIRVEEEPAQVVEQGGGGSGSNAIGTSESFNVDSSSLMLGVNPTEREMKQLLKVSMRAAGIHDQRHFNDELIQSVMSNFHSMRVMFALYPAEKRNLILDELLEQWHLQDLVPQVDDTALLEEIGGIDTPRLLVLAIRAATVVYAENHNFVNFASFRTDDTTRTNDPTEYSTNNPALLLGSASAATISEEPNREEEKQQD